VDRRDMRLQCRTKDEAFDLIKDVGSGTYGLVSKCARRHHISAFPCTRTRCICIASTCTFKQQPRV
jgi:hypothetical protein